VCARILAADATAAPSRSKSNALHLISAVCAPKFLLRHTEKFEAVAMGVYCMQLAPALKYFMRFSAYIRCQQGEWGVVLNVCRFGLFGFSKVLTRLPQQFYLISKYAFYANLRAISLIKIEILYKLWLQGGFVVVT
jgi:hypothetical protein